MSLLTAAYYPTLPGLYALKMGAFSVFFQQTYACSLLSVLGGLHLGLGIANYVRTEEPAPSGSTPSPPSSAASLAAESAPIPPAAASGWANHLIRVVAGLVPPLAAWGSMVLPAQWGMVLL